MELTQLRYFVLAAEYGSTARAAAQAMVAQSTVSKSILRLEQELALPLFDRVGNRLSLNPAGQELLQQVRPILTAVEKLPGFVKSRHQPRRQYRVSVSAGQPAMGGFLHRFLEREPEARLILTEGKWIDDCDLSITATPSGRQEDSIPLLEERILLAVPRRLLPPGEGPLELMQLEGMPLILPEKGAALRELLDQQVLSGPAVLEPLAELPDPEMVRDLVEKGDGAAFWPEKTWPAPDPAQTVLRSLSGIPLRRTLYAILPPQRRETGPLLEAVTAYFAELQAL